MSSGGSDGGRVTGKAVLSEEEEAPLPEKCCFMGQEDTRYVPGTYYSQIRPLCFQGHPREILETSTASPPLPISVLCARPNNRALPVLLDFIGICLV